MRVRAVMAAGAVAAMGLVALPQSAGATVHEITGMFCAGDHGNHEPPGISGRSNADNFAKPLNATGFVASVAPYGGDGTNGAGVLISFDFDHPASKLAPHPTLATFFFGGGVYVTAFVLDADHGFANCVRLRTS